jgi:hypothetical protein
MRVCAVCDDFSVLNWAKIACEFLDLVWGNIQGSRKVSFAVPFRCQRRNNLDALLSVQLDFQVCGDLRKLCGIR